MIIDIVITDCQPADGDTNKHIFYRKAIDVTDDELGHKTLECFFISQKLAAYAILMGDADLLAETERKVREEEATE